MSKTKTKGDVDPENLNIGDVLYEYEYNVCIKSIVETKPVRSINEDGKEVWEWTSHLASNPKSKINYLITEGFSHYGPNVYSYEAYDVRHTI